MKNENSYRTFSLKGLLEKSKTWQKIVMSLAVVVVFAATYLLILPAFTLNEKWYHYTHGSRVKLSISI